MSAIFHIGLMAAGFLLTGAGISIAAFMRGRRWWVKFHRAAGIAATACMTAGFIAAFILVEDSSGIHFRILHARTGAAAIISAATTLSLGFMQFRIRKPQVRAAHRWLGRTTLALTLAAAVMGLYAAGFI